MMVAEKLLITESAMLDVAKRIENELGEDAPDIRYVPMGDVSTSDFLWADSWAGFQMPVSPCESGIRWYHAATDGVDGFQQYADDFERTGALMTHTVASMPSRIAEYALGHVLAQFLHVKKYARIQENAQWEKIEAGTLWDAHVTVIGTGNIGQAIARAFGVFARDVRGLSLSGEPRPNFDAVASLRSGNYIADANVIVAVLPKTAASAGVIDRAVFERMNHAIFVNVGRGTTVDSEALHDALDSGWVDYAILDVFETEPLPATDWRWSHPRVSITPHVSGVTSVDDITGDFLKSFNALRVGEVPPNAIDLKRGY